jgi:hypothetical protein
MRRATGRPLAGVCGSEQGLVRARKRLAVLRFQGPVRWPLSRDIPLGRRGSFPARQDSTRAGDPEPIYLEETDTSFAIECEGHYRFEGSAFVYADRATGRVTTILGYPTQKIAQAG